MFEFGKNWQSFSEKIDPDRIVEACRSLEELIGRDSLEKAAFLDIGCGSGLFSIAAARLGAAKVVGIDVDPVSVETSQANMNRWLPGANIQFQLASILDENAMEALGTFDVVYSWGVLHHTGNMARALRSAVHRVKPGGIFAIAIYNQHWTSPIWLVIKRFYNRLPAFGRRILVWLFVPIIYLAKFMVTGRNPLKIRRGMDFRHNLVDWLGGYPYEYVGSQQLTKTLQALGLRVLRIIPASIPTGCNEFVCQKS